MAGSSLSRTAPALAEVCVRLRTSSFATSGWEPDPDAVERFSMEERGVGSSSSRACLLPLEERESGDTETCLTGERGRGEE